MLPHRHLRAVAHWPTVSCLFFRPPSSLSPSRTQDFPPHHSSITRPRNRGKKTKSIITLDDPPQGLIALDPLPLEDEVPSYPTVVLQARNHMRKHENCVLLTRVGGFYELYFEHADEFGPLLNLKVAQKRVNGGRTVSMVRAPIASQPHLADRIRLVSLFSSWTVI